MLLRSKNRQPKFSTKPHTSTLSRLECYSGRSTLATTSATPEAATSLDEDRFRAWVFDGLRFGGVEGRVGSRVERREHPVSAQLDCSMKRPDCARFRMLRLVRTRLGSCSELSLS